MFDFAGWFVAGAIAFTLCQVNFLKPLESKTDEELIHDIFEAKNIFSKIDDVKLYPVKGGKR